MRNRLFVPTPPATVQSDLSATSDEGAAPPRVRDHHRPRAWQERQVERERQSTALLNVFHQMLERMGGILALTQAAAAGDVLGARSLTLPTAGFLSATWKQPAQTVVVANHSPADMVVVAGTGQGQAPTVGTGVFRVPAGVGRVLPMRGTAITVYGIAGAAFDVVALARPREPSSAVLNPGPLDGVVVPAGTTSSQQLTLTGNLERAVVVVNISAIVPGSLTVALNGLTPSGYSYPILTSAALVAVGTTPLRIGPDLVAVANQTVDDVVPRQLQVVATVVGSVTYGVDVIAGR